MLVAGVMLAAGARAQAPVLNPDQSFAAALGGRWTRTGACDRSVQFRLAGDTLQVVGADGKIDTQQVLQRRAGGISTKTTSSAHGNPIGKLWVYELLAPGQLSLTDQVGRSADFQRCRDPIAATATPSEFLSGLFAVYEDDADASLPFASAVGLHAFLMPDLADQIARYDARLQAGGRIDRVCLLISARN